MRQDHSTFHAPPRCIRRRGFAAFAIALVLAALGAPAAAQAGSGQLQLTAMTYNLFQGSELTDAIAATTPAQLLAAVATDYGQVQATNFPERAQAIAAQAESAKPDLIGVQEAALWQTGAPSATYPPPAATAVSYDFVKILAAALNADGLHYAPVTVTSNFTVAGPGLFPSGFMNVQLTDRVAILARTDVPLSISHAQTGNFTHNTVLNTFTGPIALTGGWASVDATLGGHTVRFITTHLDPNSATVGTAQATELVDGPLSTTLPVVLTCDCNAAPGSATYQVLTGAGLQDSWRQAQTGEPGYTCCQSPTLLNPTATLTSRIDYIFSRGGRLTAGDAEIVGADQGDRSTPSGFWPSDHAGLIAALQQN
jgi:endonuclease/exonuclease/phosphatase family metal-dependent hydrolase